MVMLKRVSSHERVQREENDLNIQLESFLNSLKQQIDHLPRLLGIWQNIYYTYIFLRVENFLMVW